MSGAPASPTAEGKALIIANGEFAGDAKALRTALKKLGFDVYLRRDLSAAEMEASLAAASTLDYSKYGVFLLVVCSHAMIGSEGVTTVCGCDGKLVDVRRSCEPFDANASLAGKPKVLIIQVGCLPCTCFHSILSGSLR